MVRLLVDLEFCDQCLSEDNLHVEAFDWLFTVREPIGKGEYEESTYKFSGCTDHDGEAVRFHNWIKANGVRVVKGKRTEETPPTPPNPKENEAPVQFVVEALESQALNGNPSQPVLPPAEDIKRAIEANRLNGGEQRPIDMRPRTWGGLLRERMKELEYTGQQFADLLQIPLALWLEWSKNESQPSVEQAAWITEHLDLDKSAVLRALDIPTLDSSPVISPGEWTQGMIRTEALAYITVIKRVRAGQRPKNLPTWASPTNARFQCSCGVMGSAKPAHVREHLKGQRTGHHEISFPNMPPGFPTVQCGHCGQPFPHITSLLFHVGTKADHNPFPEEGRDIYLERLMTQLEMLRKDTPETELVP